MVLTRCMRTKISDSVKELIKLAQQDGEKDISDYETMNRSKRKKDKLTYDYYFIGTEEEIKEHEKSRN